MLAIDGRFFQTLDNKSIASGMCAMPVANGKDILLSMIRVCDSGRATMKKEYSGLELTQRGILLLMMVAPPSAVAIYFAPAKPSLILYVAIIVFPLILMILELRKAEKISPDQ